MKIAVSILVAFFIGIMTVHATSVDESMTATKAAKKTIKLKWSTLKCEQYGGPTKTYFVKGVDDVLYKIKDKNWDCLKNASVFKYDAGQCICKQYIPEKSSAGDNDDTFHLPTCKKKDCGLDDDDSGGTTSGGTTNAGTTDAGTTDAGTTDAGTTDAGTTDAGATTGATTAGNTTGSTDAGSADAGATDGGGSTSAGATTGSTDAGTTGGGTDAGTTNGATTAGTLNGDQ